MDLLPLVEFAYNNTIHSSSKQTPFFANYRQHLRADPFQVRNVGSYVVEELATHVANIYKKLTFKLQEALEQCKIGLSML